MAGESLARAGRIFAIGMRLTYEYIGLVIIVSFLWFVVGLGPAVLTGAALIRQPGIPFLVTFAVAVMFFTSPATASVYSMTGKIVAREETKIREFFTGFVRHFRRASLLGGLNLLILLILASDLLFALTNPNVVIRFLSGLWAYLALFWLMMLPFLFPLLVRRDRGILTTMKQAALIVLDNVVVALLLLIQTLLLAGTSVIFMAALFLLFIVSTGFLHNVALAEVLKRYEKVGPLPPDQGEGQSEGESPGENDPR